MISVIANHSANHASYRNYSSAIHAFPSSPSPTSTTPRDFPQAPFQSSRQFAHIVRETSDHSYINPQQNSYIDNLSPINDAKHSPQTTIHPHMLIIPSPNTTKPRLPNTKHNITLISPNSDNNDCCSFTTLNEANQNQHMQNILSILTRTRTE